jgi:SAM-dependent methyltransferase
MAPDYGLDAPAVVKRLAVASAAGLAVFSTAALGLWSGAVTVGPVRFELTGMGLGVGLGCGLMAAYMAWSSRTGKRLEREKLLDRVTWRGTERVLDVGCGRGLMLVGAAKRLSTGTAVGIDLWQQEDLGDNGPDGALENAKLEGVGDRVKVQTGDMRKLPFGDGAFDVVVSKAAIHNVYDKGERGAVMRELARVLAPGGRLLIDDIRHIGEYAAALREAGLTVERVDRAAVGAAFALLTFGSLNPGQLVAQKA